MPEKNKLYLVSFGKGHSRKEAHPEMFFKRRGNSVLGLLLLGTFFFTLSVKAEDLRDRLLPRTLISALKLIPFPLDLELGENCTKKREIDRVFSLREQLEFIEEFSPGKLEELIQYSDFVTRQLLLDIDEQDLLSLDTFLEAGVGGAPIDAKRAHWAAYQAKVGILSSLHHAATTVAREALSGVSTPSRSHETWTQSCTWSLAQKRYFSFVSGSWFGPNPPSVRLEFIASSSNDALPILQGVLKTLPEKNPDLLATKVYEISKLIHLDWLVRKGPRYYDVFFRAAYRLPIITDFWDVLKTTLESELSKEAVKDNSFLIELKYFLERAEEKLPLN